jgi:hypothetical protein
MYTGLLYGDCRNEVKLVDDEVHDVPPLCHDAMHACLQA